MRITFKILVMISAFSIFLINPDSSFAWSGHGGWGGHGGGWHGGYGHHGGSWGWGGYRYGLNFSYWPDYYDSYDGVLVSPPAVETPVIVQTTPTYQPESQVTAAETIGLSDNEITINVPNDSGGYTAVVLKKSGSGYIGPQGEYYQTFPKVSQLSLMYGTANKS